MRCPFLREAQVKTCQASAYRKPILRGAHPAAGERCSSPAYVECPGVHDHHQEHADPARCPFLQESLAQYCAAASVPKYVPYSESSNCRCGNDTHRYCEAYQAVAGSPVAHASTADGIPVPAGLWYAKNHLWLDLADDGTCHVGADGLLARVLGPIERLVFVTARGTRRPAAVVTVNGIDLQVVFPNAFRITGTNPVLRAHPERLVEDPYGLGWMFEGVNAGVGVGSATAALVPGTSALGWMRSESARLTDFAHELVARPDADGVRLAADGGAFADGLLHHITREETLSLFDAFFREIPS